VKILGLLIGLSSFFLVSCAQYQTFPIERNGNLENYVVELTAARGAGKLKVHKSPKKCSNGKEGCMEFSANTVGTVRFQFKGNQRDRDCTTSPKANWVITEIQLSGTGDPSTDKGTFPDTPETWLIDAFPGINESNGVIYTSTADTASKSVTIINLNNNTLANPKDVYYQVTATSCLDRVPPIGIDPKIRNLGK